jgi:3-hydroxy-9,10-secoandrosta-1,3,5(10)-triene-9,17-dione monooxygenase
MPTSTTAPQTATKQQVMERVKAIAPAFAERAEVAEEARRLPMESVREMLDAGIARILMPTRFGGYGLGFDTWFDVVQEISKVDASHGWCAALIIHHAHLIAQYHEEAQQAVWADGPDVAIAASFAPTAQVSRVDGGYRISGQHSAFASGVGHCSWVMVGGLVKQDGGEPEWLFCLIPPGQYTVRDTWFTIGMRGTGSNTIVTDNVFVPATRVLSLKDLRDGTGPGGATHASPIYRTLFFHYAPITFVVPMLGAAQGAYERFREWTRTRTMMGGGAVAQKTSVQVRMARAAADLDAAELLVRRAMEMPYAQDGRSPQLLARSVRDFTRVAELVVSAIDTLIALSGTAGFTTTHPIQRAWRDIHLASAHIAINPENNYAHYGRMELGLGRDPSMPYF